MRKKVLRYSCILIALTCLGACMRQLVESIEPNPQEEKKPLSIDGETKGNATVDTLSRIIVRQSDPDMRMLNQILFVDGQYRLALSESEANSLGIPSSIFKKYIDYVNRLNERINHDNQK